MKKFAVIGCIFMIVEAGELGQVSRFFHKAPAEIREYIGEFIDDWELQATIIMRHGERVTVKALNFDGSLLVGMTWSPRDTYIFNTVSGALVKKINLSDALDPSRVNCIFNKEGTVLVVTDSNGFHIISINSQGNQTVISNPLRIERRSLSFVAFNPRNPNELLCASLADPLEVRDSKTGQIMRSFGEESASGPEFCFSSDGRYIAFGTSLRIRIWDVDRGEAVLDLGSVFSSYIAGIFYTRDNNLLVVHQDYKYICFFKGSTGSGGCIAVNEFIRDSLGKPFFIQQKNIMMRLGAKSRQVIMFEIALRQYAYLEGFTNITALSVAQDGVLAAFGGNGTVTLWNTDLKKVERVLSAGNRPIGSLLWSGDGKTLVAQDAAGKIYIWRKQSYGEQIRAVEETNEAVRRLRMRRFLRDLKLITLVADL